MAFVYSSSDRVLVFETAKFVQRYPRSYFGALFASLGAGMEGRSQEKPVRIPLPEWFIAAFAEWSLPLGPSSVFFPVDRRPLEVWHYLDAISWAIDAKYTDIPIHGFTRSSTSTPNSKNQSRLTEIIYDLCKWGASISSNVPPEGIPMFFLTAPESWGIYHMKNADLVSNDALSRMVRKHNGVTHLSKAMWEELIMLIPHGCR